MTGGAEPWNLTLAVARTKQESEAAMTADGPDIAGHAEPKEEAESEEPAHEAKLTSKVEGDQNQASSGGSKKARRKVVRVDQHTKDGGDVYTQTVKRSTWKISSKYALVVRHVFDHNGILEETLIEVRGQGLRDVLLDILKGASGLRLNEKPPVIQPKLLYHCVSKLTLRLDEELAREQKNDDLVFEIEAALQVIKEDFAQDEESIQSLLGSGQITFDTLWAIFPPNELVYTQNTLGEPCAYRAIDSGVWEKQDGTTVFYVLGRKTDSDGTTLGWTRSEMLEVPSFTGEKTITDLAVYPLRFHERSAHVRAELVDRGRRRIQLHKKRFYEYNGPAVQEVESALGLRSEEKFSCQGRIIIDPSAFSDVEPGNHFVPLIRQALDEDQLTDDELVTMSAMAYGFSLTEKVWGAFAVSRVTEIEWDSTIWNSLVLPDATKRLVRTLVKSHVGDSNNGFDDFVRGKGKGLVGLLAGPPGVGKTLTAEAVAETVQRPLYVLSSGELGSDPDRIDGRLRRVLRLAQTWKAVLLLDEADVFMAKRTATDLTRNAIVSIFLRQLEYYQGILILTTNRVDDMDDAFRSRIHFHLSYSDLDSAARKAIWRGFLANANDASADPIDVDGSAIDSLAKLEINGRQIKNIMKMSRLFAAEEGRSLALEDILMLADMS